MKPNHHFKFECRDLIYKIFSRTHPEKVRSFDFTEDLFSLGIEIKNPEYLSVDEDIYVMIFKPNRYGCRVKHYTAKSFALGETKEFEMSSLGGIDFIVDLLPPNLREELPFLLDQLNMFSRMSLIDGLNETP